MNASSQWKGCDERAARNARRAAVVEVTQTHVFCGDYGLMCCVQHNRSLLRLGLDYNQIDADTTQALADALKVRTKWEQIAGNSARVDREKSCSSTTGSETLK